MARSYRDRVLVTTTTTLTGTLTQSAAVTGFQAPPAGDDAKTFVICIYAVDANGNPTGDWEVTETVYTHSGTTWSRGTLMASSTGSRVSFAAGTKYIAVVSDAAKTALPDVQIFTGSGTWTAPAGINFVSVSMVAAGGGGGSGRRGAAGSNRYGGAGGAGGGRSVFDFPASVCGASQTVTIGAIGTGGAAITADSTNGNAGTNGGDTTFGSLLKAAGGGGGGGGNNSFASGGVTGSGTYGTFPGEGGGSSYANTGNSPDTILFYGKGGGGGASGGGLNTSNAAGAGGTGGTRPTDYDGGGAGAAGTVGAGQAGGVGGSVTTNVPSGGAGGGGGAGNAGAAAGAGGAGGSYGGGGAGGGGSLNGFASGAGGAGGPGICVVVSW